jgi:hypothetical protein
MDPGEGVEGGGGRGGGNQLASKVQRPYSGAMGAATRANRATDAGRKGSRAVFTSQRTPPGCNLPPPTSPKRVIRRGPTAMPFDAGLAGDGAPEKPRVAVARLCPGAPESQANWLRAHSGDWVRISFGRRRISHSSSVLSTLPFRRTALVARIATSRRGVKEWRLHASASCAGRTGRCAPYGSCSCSCGTADNRKRPRRSSLQRDSSRTLGDHLANREPSLVAGDTSGPRGRGDLDIKKVMADAGPVQQGCSDRLGSQGTSE